MSKFAGIFLVFALWSPCLFWGDFISTKDGRTTLGQASTIEWIVLWFLAIAPYFVITNIQPKDDDRESWFRF